MAQPVRGESNVSFLEPTVKLVLGLIFLYALERFTLSLPVVREHQVVVLLSTADWIRLAVGTGMIAFFWTFARETAGILRGAYPNLPDFARMAVYAGVMISAAIGYGTFLPLLRAALPQALSIYQAVLLIGVIVPFALLIVTFFRRLPALVMAMSLWIKRLVTVYPVVRCHSCTGLVPADHHYCSACGAAVSPAHKQDA
jgi:hypothetical protein